MFELSLLTVWYLLSGIDVVTARCRSPISRAANETKYR
jgi:hypothetical protein